MWAHPQQPAMLPHEIEQLPHAEVCKLQAQPAPQNLGGVQNLDRQCEATPSGLGKLPYLNPTKIANAMHHAVGL